MRRVSVAKLRALGAPRLIEAATADGLAFWLRRLRATIHERVTAAIQGPAGPVAVALITGERAAIPEEELQAMRDAGLAHLLAVSGLNITIVAGLLLVGLRGALALIPPLALRAPIKKALFG